MRRLFCIVWLGLVLTASAGCQGWDIGAHWIGDGNTDPDSQTALSDGGVGRDVARSVVGGSDR
jgi:hypothetical protein